MQQIVRYQTPNKDGETRWQRNIRFGQGDKNPLIEPPQTGEYIFEWFWELNSSRQSGFGGPLPLSYTEIAAWAAITGTIATRDEISIIRRLDSAYIAAVAAEQAANAAQPPNG